MIEKSREEAHHSHVPSSMHSELLAKMNRLNMNISSNLRIFRNCYDNVIALVNSAFAITRFAI